MSRASDLFRKLSEGGVVALNRLLDDLEPEGLFLDFKLSDTGGARSLGESDRKNLAKAVSGFANSEGGVLVWGVDCRPNETGREEATKRPLADPVELRAKIDNAISGLTLPPQNAIETAHFLESDGSGYVVVHIPKSVRDPVRSLKSDQYHMRVGSNFAVVPHGILAGLFGQHPQPMISHNLLPHEVRREGSQTTVFAFGLHLANVGSVIAEQSYVSIWRNNLEGIRMTVNSNSSRMFLQTSNLPVHALVAHPGIFIAPGAVEDVCDVIFEVRDSDEGPITLDLTFGARGSTPDFLTIELTADAIEAARGGARWGARLPLTDYWTLTPDSS